MRQAAAFADAALRRVLEVIDRRRPAAALRGVLAPGLVDSVLAVSRSATAPGGAAVLRRVRVQPVGPDADTTAEAAAAAEVSGSYGRGNRLHAIACRVERPVSTGSHAGGSRWMVVALHIG